jgi:hypothetical protein
MIVAGEYTPPSAGAEFAKTVAKKIRSLLAEIMVRFPPL